jgi:hypothetical protein
VCTVYTMSISRGIRWLANEDLIQAHDPLDCPHHV